MDDVGAVSLVAYSCPTHSPCVLGEDRVPLISARMF